MRIVDRLGRALIIFNNLLLISAAATESESRISRNNPDQVGLHNTIISDGNKEGQFDFSFVGSLQWDRQSCLQWQVGQHKDPRQTREGEKFQDEESQEVLETAETED